MSIIQGNSKTSAAGYTINQSARFNDGDSPELSRTYTLSAPWTFSAWVKRCELGAVNILLGTSGSSPEIQFNSGDTITAEALTTTAVFRDPASWYHIHVSDNGLYINGISFGAVTTTSLTNAKLFDDFDGYVAEVHLQSGTSAYTNFGEINSDTGQWVPKAATAGDTYLKFGNSSNFGKNSGTGGAWTASGLTSADQVTDTPTNNFATFNPLQYSAITFANGNLDVTCPTATNTHTAMSTFAASSGKWGCQITPTSTFGMVGVCLTTVAANTTPRSSAGAYGVDHGGDVYKNGSFSSNIGATFTANDDLELLFDADAGTLTVKKNGSAFCTITSIPAGNYNFFWADVATSQASTATGDFGQLSYTPSDAAYKTFCTNNLPDPTIALPSDYFQTVLDTGANIKTTAEALYTDQFEWIKDRANANNHQLIDSVRGTSAVIWSNGSTAETTYSTPSGNSVGWVWNQNGTGSTNNDGSITSTAAPNTTSGFSTVTYTGSGVANDTVGHGLGAAPAMIMCFCLDSTANGIRVFHENLTAGTSLYLNETYQAYTEGDRIASPTSTTFTVTGTAANKVNGSGGNYLAYCFAEVEGFSNFSNYTGNGNANGPFIYCGFKPAWVLIKRISSPDTGNWEIFDSLREGYNADNDELVANTTAAETTTDYLDILSNGFKIRTTDSDFNTSGSVYVYAAFAEAPFRYANAR